LPGSSGSVNSYLCHLCSGNYKHGPPFPACLLTCDVNNFLPWLTSNHNPPDLCFPRSWDYSCKPLYLVLQVSFQTAFHDFFHFIPLCLLFLIYWLSYNFFQLSLFNRGILLSGKINISPSLFFGTSSLTGRVLYRNEPCKKNQYMCFSEHIYSQNKGKREKP
jgi:hypothetical protein